jgi:hypothetical protein
MLYDFINEHKLLVSFATGALISLVACSIVVYLDYRAHTRIK